MNSQIERLIAAIAVELGYDSARPPVQVSAEQAAAVLGVKVSTLAVWRSSGRYNLPYTKSGRLVRYRIADLARHIAGRTYAHTGMQNHPGGPG